VAIASGGGTLAGATTRLTDGQGRAVFSDLAITGDPGPRTLAFTASGYTRATSATIDVQAAPPSASTSTALASPTTILVGESSTITVTVRDAGGTPLAGRTVTLVSSGSGDSIVPSSAVSGSDGAASFTFSSTVAETETLSATADGIAIGSVQVTVQ
jgi:hypothetical protein